MRDLCTTRGPDGRLSSPKLLAPKIPNWVVPSTPITAYAKAGTAVRDPDTDERLALFDPKTRALVRLAALGAAGGAGPSYGAEIDDAVRAGASAAEIVDVVEAVVPIVGLPCAVTAAPLVAMALGFDVDDAL